MEKRIVFRFSFFNLKNENGKTNRFSFILLHFLHVKCNCGIVHAPHCSTTILSKHITSALTAVKDNVIKYSETAFSNSNVNYFWSIKNSSEVIEKLRLRNFQGSQVSSFDFSTLYTSLPHDLIKAKVLSLVKWCFNRESKTYICTSDKTGFSPTRTSLEATGSWSPSPLIVRAFGPELAYGLCVAQPTLMDVPIYFWYTILLYIFVYHIFMTSPLWLAVGPQSLSGWLFTNF